MASYLLRVTAIFLIMRPLHPLPEEEPQNPMPPSPVIESRRRHRLWGEIQLSRLDGYHQELLFFGLLRGPARQQALHRPVAHGGLQPEDRLRRERRLPLLRHGGDSILMRWPRG